MRLPRLVLSMSWFKLLASQISVTQAPSKTCRRLRPDSLVCVGCNTSPQRSKVTCPPKKRPSLEGNSSGNGSSVIHVTSPYPQTVHHDLRACLFYLHFPLAARRHSVARGLVEELVVGSHHSQRSRTSQNLLIEGIAVYACLSVSRSAALNHAGNGDLLKELHKDQALIRPEVNTDVNHVNKWNIPMCRVHHKRKRTWRTNGPKEIHLRAS